MQYFDLARQGLRAMAKRWQGGKGAGKGLKLMVLGPWWNVLRAGFETLYFDLARQGQSAKGAQEGFVS